MTEIETHRLLLRRWREGDLDAYARICADPEVMKYLPETLGWEESAEKMAGFVRHWEERGFGLWAVEEKASGGVYRLYRDNVPRRLARGGAQDRGRVEA